MDLICPICGEPWEHDSLHEETELRYEQEHGVDYTTAYRQNSVAAGKLYQPIYNEVARSFRTRGCQTLRELRGTDAPCEPNRSVTTAVAIAAYEVCGDDMDGAAALIEDFSG